MSGIDYRRVLLGGLVAGVALAIVYLLLHDLIGDTPARTESFVAFLILGFVLTWLYAAFRPRLGSGWQTAVLTGCVAWFLVFLLPFFMLGALTNNAIGRVDRGQLLLSMILLLAMVVGGSLVGGWLYREPDRSFQGLADLPPEDEEDAAPQTTPAVKPEPQGGDVEDSASKDAVRKKPKRSRE